jgi:pyrroloquinoline quinone biosynthesis protein D
MSLMDLADEVARPRLAKHVRLRYDAARSQYALLSPETIYVINASGAAILELCDGERTIAQIQEELGRTYDQVAEGDVRRFVAALVAKHSMEVDGG